MSRWCMVWLIAAIFAAGWCSNESAAAATTSTAEIHVYTLKTRLNADGFDEAIALTTMQGVINREAPVLYVLNDTFPRPASWLEAFAKEGEWLQGRPQQPLADLTAVRHLAGERLKGVIIWDPAVPATLNVANTIAGVEDGVVLSPALAEQYRTAWGLPVLRDLRGMFTGAETGSKKNDAYRWAIREYLAKGRCSPHFLCLYADAWRTRDMGDIAYVSVRDWAVRQRAFVLDLSPWGDEAPKDDPVQALGTDLATYKLILAETMKQAAGKEMTELAGFFNFYKYSNMPPEYPSTHDPVPTEWETVHLISPYNCYQNTATANCYNQSFHAHAPFQPLKQGRPTQKKPLENKTYIAVLMADYDSAEPLYHFLPKHWDDPLRGKIPLAWGINPNLIETYPDLITYFYKQASPMDFFVSDASAAGYMNPNRLPEASLPLFVRHNKYFFEQTDQTIAAMVLDWDEPTTAVKNAFTQFAPDGYATIVMDLHGNGGKPPTPHVWKGMPVTQLHSPAAFTDTATLMPFMINLMKAKDPAQPAFQIYRSVWVSPTQVQQALDLLKTQAPESPFELVDIYTFFDLFKRHQAGEKF